jgi:4-amino-4-deoxy-L-arabinose transferase-like glycosyltransferase
LRLVFPLLAAGILLAHTPLLHLPWFWDEAGYYIPAALDFFHTGSLVPHSTLTNAHPPLPSVLLAGWWSVFGLSFGISIAGTRAFLCLLAALALTAFFRLARQLAGQPVAIAATLLTALYPIWFSQSSLAHADLFAAVFTLWALAFYFERREPLAVAILFSLAALSKETAIVTPVALAAWEIFRRIRSKHGSSRLAAALAFPILPLVLWYAYHRHATGFTFGNPEFLRYNATANLSAARILLSLWHRVLHLLVHMNMFVPVVCALACLPIPKRPDAEQEPVLTAPILRTLAVILVANAVAFSVLGGALLTRYLLPMYPLILLVCAAVWHQRLRRWQAVAALTALAFALALFINPPYSIAPEDNLTYADFIALHQRAIAILSRDLPDATVLTAWPATAELNSPSLGYVTRPIHNVPIDNFSLAEIQKAAQQPAAFDTALVFSTKWVPATAALPGQATGLNEQADTRFFDFHRDLTPPEIARLLHGQILWQAHANGEWIAILRFPRATDARRVPHDRFERSEEAIVGLVPVSFSGVFLK